MFIRFCEHIEAVESGVSEKILIPKINYEDERRTDLLTADAAEEIQAYLDQYEYATLCHAMFDVIWHTGIRTGTLQSFDIDDYHPEEKYLAVKHRPETGTPLKNKERGERELNLSKGVCNVLTHYVEMHRHDVRDEYDRQPLFTVRSDRVGKTVIQKHIYAVTRPCYYTNSCPHEKDPLDCEAARAYDAASKYPSSLSPHPIRRGAITAHLNADVPTEIASDRMDVSQDVLEKHYDGRIQAERRKQRRAFLDEL